MMSELEIIRQALQMGLSTHGDPCALGEDCLAITQFREALAAVERLEAETKRIELLSIEMAVKRDFANLEVDRLQTRVGELEASALNSSGDNLCWLTEATGGRTIKIPPREEFLESCRRFHAQISGQAGELAGCKTIAQLETENTLLRAERQSDTEILDWLEKWLTEDPTRYQIALRRMEADGTFIVALRPKMEKMPMFSGRNGFGKTLRAAIESTQESANG